MTTTLHLSRHARERMAERHISVADVDAALAEPLLSFPSRNHMGDITVYEDDRTRVVVGGSTVVTVCWATGAAR